jgi:hypothetical protein
MRHALSARVQAEPGRDPPRHDVGHQFGGLQRIADISISSASAALPGDTTSLIAVCHLLSMLADGLSSPGFYVPGSAGHRLVRF